MNEKDCVETNVELLRCGNVEGLKNLYEMTKRSVFMAAFVVLRCYQSAEDVMQETYVKIRANIGQYQTGTSFKAWAITIARNLALKELRKRGKMQPLDVIEGTIFDQETDSYLENSIVLRDALKHLDEKERQVVILFAVEGLKHREIAEILGIPLGTVTWIYSKALKKLREILKEGEQ